MIYYYVINIQFKMCTCNVALCSNSLLATLKNFFNLFVNYYFTPKDYEVPTHGIRNVKY